MIPFAFCTKPEHTSPFFAAIRPNFEGSLPYFEGPPGAVPSKRATPPPEPPEAEKRPVTPGPDHRANQWLYGNSDPNTFSDHPIFRNCVSCWSDAQRLPRTRKAETTRSIPWAWGLATFLLTSIIEMFHALRECRDDRSHYRRLDTTRRVYSREKSSNQESFLIFVLARIGTLLHNPEESWDPQSLKADGFSVFSPGLPCRAENLVISWIWFGRTGCHAVELHELHCRRESCWRLTPQSGTSTFVTPQNLE